MRAMNTSLLVANIVLVVLVLGLAFLVIGALRSLGVMGWRLEQMEATTPRRIGRDGLPAGRKAPDFTLRSVAGGAEVSLHDFAGRKVLLVFTQTGCGPCHAMLPELNRVQRYGEHQVVVVNNGKLEDARAAADEVKAEFIVLAQDQLSLSKRYEVFATPFAFVIDASGVVASKGTIGTPQHLGFVLAGEGGGGKKHHVEPESTSGQNLAQKETARARTI
jgi:methylamine dehydrogenase accessory protein MauD